MKSKFSENLFIATDGKITQQQLANLLGTSQATINRWIKGINEPNFDTLLKICLILDETPNSILGYDDLPKEKSKTYIKDSFNNSNNSGTFNF